MPGRHLSAPARRTVVAAATATAVAAPVLAAATSTRPTAARPSCTG
ncbi:MULTISPECIES: hypothetical protein [unclassified Streptomyces]|nr:MULTISPECIES: hypothetical protein [unclassified Streptomyces]MYR64474.1 hypothetical protein [Streptomyces sp. SID4939]MYS00149.1 hypothetical protein [Streptomyces sp. SID4940]MYT64728.1 hypothetical protein [Streptomyces sp. SID8357]MYT87726.1 hypothetical protein [Streptomyces sp. SID8360]MYW36896.1 hypothetical protein [Streptomyces sp. SID1]